MEDFQKLHSQALQLAKDYRRLEAELLDVLQRIDETKAYLPFGYSSLFQYAVEALRLSEAQAYAFMSVARKSRTIPALKAEICKGSITVSKASRIVPVLTPQNQKEWIEKASTLSKRDLEREVVKEKPTEVFESVRAVSESRLSLKLGISEDLLQKLRRVQTLVSNQKRKNVSLEEALEEAVETFLEKRDPVEKAKRQEEKAHVDRELRPGTVAEVEPFKKQIKRSIPASTIHHVHRRDRGKCTFTSTEGRRCDSPYFIDIHHIQSWSFGGRHDLKNLTTLCRSHHALVHRAVAQG